MKHYHCEMDSPIGALTLVATEAGLRTIHWHEHVADPESLGAGIDARDHSVLMETRGQLADYFAGTRRVFDLPLDFEGTEFQRAVWQALRTIPFGETRSYGALAAQIGRPGAARAVGAANARNPLPIVAPCHRVIGASGALTGFAGGLDTKRYLLDLEAGAARS